MGGKRVGCSSYVTIREGPSNKMTSEQRPGGSEGPGNRVSEERTPGKRNNRDKGTTVGPLSFILLSCIHIHTKHIIYVPHSLFFYIVTI